MWTVRVYDGEARRADYSFTDYATMIALTLDSIANGAATVEINHISETGHASLLKRFTRKPGILRHAFNWATATHPVTPGQRQSFNHWTPTAVEDHAATLATYAARLWEVSE